jgi:hypothetical protein
MATVAHDIWDVISFDDFIVLKLLWKGAGLLFGF